MPRQENVSLISSRNNGEVRPPDYRAKIRALVENAETRGLTSPYNVTPENSDGIQYEVLGPDIPLPTLATFPRSERRQLQTLGYLNVVEVTTPLTLPAIPGEPPKRDYLELSFVSISGGQNFTIKVGHEVLLEGVTLQFAHDNILEPLFNNTQQFNTFMPPLAAEDKGRIRIGGQRNLRFHYRNGNPKPYPQPPSATLPVSRNP